MSEPIPESIPTSADRRSQRPVKKRALTPVSQQSAQIDALFAHPDREVKIPTIPDPKKLAPPPEIVANVQGSSAGAGSGEFHVYKASRRREYDRLRQMDESVEQEQADKEFAARKEEQKRKDEAKTNRNKAKRDRAKARKQQAKGKGTISTEEGSVSTVGKAPRKQGLGPMKANAGGDAMDTARYIDPAEANGEAKVVDAPGIIIHDED
ncbi:DUF1168-domain-containing protein [Eremomyces bilateralis CBS 781.70]|uniref:DUF1168-domain-containing protein n=1 Tax=Eremomyces bilateralis CBS 781.70 TaxID=1392243 RepID=A0A6G1FVI1_9PEZI|nr:DUF1168-domain-containing protein [Eremomyces bilateralis CBS 781.70]KAF1809794.1 DUF1168-domain-containing protein [Eremomyces bilateralis CBS 781.70]